MPITQRLFFVFSTALLLMILLLSGYTILTVQKYLEREALVQMKELARNIKLRNISDPEKAKSLANESIFLNRYEILISGSGLPEFGKSFAKDSIPEIAWNFTKNGDALFTYSDDNWIYVTASWLENESRLTIRKRRSDVGAALRPIRHIIYTGMLISLVFIALVSVLTARSLAKPIKEIAQAAEAIAAGDRGRSLELNRKDEFGRMADSLNRMADRLLKESDVQRELNTRLRNFHSDLAHEIRNPLHAMNTAIDMLAMENLPPESRKRYETMVQLQSARLNRLFSDLLTLQKFESLENELQLAPLHVEKVINDVVSLLGQEIERKKLNIEINVSETPVLANQDRLEQIFENLLANAVKFSDAGIIRIFTIDTAQALEIHVQDEGCGIPVADLDKIFDRFYRVEKSRNSERGGTGLGLAVVKALVKAHGSEIFVKSNGKSGSDFYFRLAKAV